jgi:hypothetical protein
MEYIVLSWGFSKDDTSQINHCHLAFWAMTAADVLTGDGLRDTQNAIDLGWMSRPSSTWDWLNESPSTKNISHWKAGLKQITSVNFHLPCDMTGPLDRAPTSSVAMWFYCRCKHQLYHCTNGVWHYYIPSECSTVAFKWVGIIASLPIPINKLE